MLPENKLFHKKITRSRNILKDDNLNEIYEKVRPCSRDCPSCAVDNYIEELEAYLDSDELGGNIAEFLYTHFYRFPTDHNEGLWADLPQDKKDGWSWHVEQIISLIGGE